jgi:uncharacterized protein
MPTNLPPDYYDAEKRYREAGTPSEKILHLEEMIKIVPKHKGTDHLRADLRRTLSKLKEDAQARKKQGGHSSVFNIEREGAGQAVLFGMPNSGKSALVAALTNAEPEVSEAPFTTWTPLPGMMTYQDIQIQLIDTPPLDRGFVDPQLFDLARRTDVILLVVDLLADPVQQVEDSLEMLSERRIAPLQHQGRYEEQARMVYLPFIVLANKCDDVEMDEIYDLFCELVCEDMTAIPVSALTGRNFEAFKSRLYRDLGIIRVYARPPGKEPDMERPFVLKEGSTVEDLAVKVHRDFATKLKSARVWGSSAFEGQMVSKDYPLKEGDIVELRVL